MHSVWKSLEKSHFYNITRLSEEWDILGDFQTLCRQFPKRGNCWVCLESETHVFVMSILEEMEGIDINKKIVIKQGHISSTKNLLRIPMKS